MADAKRLRQILLNLLSNAVKYTQSGSVTLNVRYASEVATFEVIDSGIGIPEDDLERIFEPFERGRMQAMQSIAGTGLGLTIARLLASLMGGELTVESAVGKGSTFRVRMRLPRATERSEPPLEELRVRGYQGRRRSVLVADDDPAHVQLICDLLQPLGFDLSTAVDGPSCVEIARHFHAGVERLGRSASPAKDARKDREDRYRLGQCARGAYHQPHGNLARRVSRQAHRHTSAVSPDGGPSRSGMDL
jgi:CheY-like chemotaxis protein